jgi:hypothetical protein
MIRAIINSLATLKGDLGWPWIKLIDRYRLDRDRFISSPNQLGPSGLHLRWMSSKP